MRNSIETLMPTLLKQAMSEGIQRFVTAAVIGKDRGTKILCLKRASHDFMPGLFELPSGRVGECETLSAALLREVCEETNLSQTSVKEYLSFFDYKSNSGKATRQFNFLVECEDLNSFRLNPAEHEDFAWVSNSELCDYNISHETKRVIQAYFISQPVLQSTARLIPDSIEQGVVKCVVGGLIENEGKVLILRRNDNDFLGGMYEIPGGHIEKGESIAMGLIRELKEETNLDVVEITETLPHFDFDYTSASGELTRHLCFRVKVKECASIRLSEEHTGFSWVNHAELIHYPMSTEMKRILENFTAGHHETPRSPLLQKSFFNRTPTLSEVEKSDDKSKKFNMNESE